MCMFVESWIKFNSIPVQHKYRVVNGWNWKKRTHYKEKDRTDQIRYLYKNMLLWKEDWHQNSSILLLVRFLCKHYMTIELFMIQIIHILCTQSSCKYTQGLKYIFSRPAYQGRLCTLKNPCCPWRDARQQVKLWSLDDYVPLIYSWNIAECDVQQPTTILWPWPIIIKVKVS